MVARFASEMCTLSRAVAGLSEEGDETPSGAVDASVLTFCCRGVRFLKDWPIRDLANYPHQCMFHYFK